MIILLYICRILPLFNLIFTKLVRKTQARSDVRQKIVKGIRKNSLTKRTGQVFTETFAKLYMRKHYSYIFLNLRHEFFEQRNKKRKQG